jgi:hypothetical protein
VHDLPNLKHSAHSGFSAEHLNFPFLHSSQTLDLRIRRLLVTGGFPNGYREVRDKSNKLMLTTFAAIIALSLLTSSAANKAQPAFRPAARKEFRQANGPRLASYFSKLARKTCRGSWQANAIPLIALTWLAVASVGTIFSRCRRAVLRPWSSMTTCWYSEDAPPASLSALLTL